MNIKDILINASSLSDACRQLGFPINGTGYRKVKELLTEYSLPLPKYQAPRRYPLIEKECPVCRNIFEASKGSPKEKATCSYACSNTYFRSGDNNGAFKAGEHTNYRQYAMRKLPNKCSDCGWDLEPKVLVVHHKNRNRSDNSLENLAILCPTCHQMEHFRKMDGRFSKIK